MIDNAFGILVSQFRVPLATREQRPKVVRDIVFTCVTLHNMLRTHRGRADRASDAADLQSEQVVYVPNDKYRDPSR